MEEILEPVVDNVTDVAAGRLPGGTNLGHLAVVSAVALGAGAGIAWLISKQYYKSKYERLAEQEIAEAKAFYSQFYKKDDYATPGDAVEALGAGGTEAAVALEQYGAKRLQDVAVNVVETVDIEVKAMDSEEPIRSNIFTDRESDEVWDQDKEEAYRASLDPGVPYIISQMEFNENPEDHDQQTLTYFAEDDVLVDEKDQPISLTDQTVGDENLTRFGHGHMDNRIVLVRNDRLQMDFEVVLNDGSYAKQVLGFQHSDEPTVKKFRRGGDE